MDDAVMMTTITEGEATVRVPATGSAAERRGKSHVAGPGKVEGGLFFNPAMRFARDLTVLTVAEQATRHQERWDARHPDGNGTSSAGTPPFVFYDGLGATGVRGIRIAKETAPHVQVVVNDRSEEACRMARQNAEANDLSPPHLTVVNQDFALGLGEQRADHVDVDPFGSPAPFIDSALRLVRNGGTIGMTATDMTALCGVYPQVCRRRYDAQPWHKDGMHEAALRILVGAAVRSATRHDLAVRPMLSHATDHYVRVFLQVQRGARRADAALGRLGWLAEEQDGTRLLVPDHEEALDVHEAENPPAPAGPLWTGPLQDLPFVWALQDRLRGRIGSAHLAPETISDPHDRALARFLERAAEEADAPPMNYSMKEWGRRAGVSPPPRADLFLALRDAGYAAARTHITGDLFKTDAPGRIIADVLRLLDRR